MGFEPALREAILPFACLEFVFGDECEDMLREIAATLVLLCEGCPAG